MPVDYWSQFVNTENVSPNLDHMIIENSNCYATPDKSMSASCAAVGATFVCSFALMSICPVFSELAGTADHPGAPAQ